jgi:hypothetical protein
MLRLAAAASNVGLDWPKDRIASPAPTRKQAALKRRLVIIAEFISFSYFSRNESEQKLYCIAGTKLSKVAHMGSAEGNMA